MSDRVGIVAAMAREIAPLVRDWKQTHLPLDGQHSRPAFECDSAIAVCSGIGAVPARRAAEALALAERPRVLISAGFAGALDSHRRVGSILQPEIVMDLSSGQHFAAQGEGTLASVDKVLDARGKGELRARCAADAVDMEAAAVAAVARKHGLPFLAIKAISDDTSFPMPSFGAVLDQGGELRWGHFAWMLVRQPSLWPILWRLRANAAIASRELCRALAGLIQQPGIALLPFSPTVPETVKQDAR